MRIKIRTYLRPCRSAKAAGRGSIYFLVTANRKRHWFATGLELAPGDWDGATECPKRNAPVATAQLLELYRSRATSYLVACNVNNKAFTDSNFIAAVFNDQDKSGESFTDLMERYCKTEKMGLGRFKHYRAFAKQLDAYRPGLSLHDVDYLFVRGLQKHLAAMGNNPNTVICKMVQLKAVVHFGMRLGLIDRDPLKEIKLGQIKGNKQHLIPEELQQLEELHRAGTMPQHLHGTLHYFLFACYTGLRYSDIAALDMQHIRGGFINITQIKTGKPVSIPIIHEAQRLLPVHATGKAFRCLSNQKSNVNLKAISNLAGIDKALTFHCSRHTFATLALYWGIPVPIVAELLGVDLRTAMVYVKISDQLKQKELAKWGGRATG